jgi:glycosyl transferase family 25
MDRIDKFIYINLDKREDRKKHILAELKKFGIPEEKIIRFSAVQNERGALGCSLSHMEASKLFKASGDKVWCFLEDDHFFTKSLEETNKYINNFLDTPAYDVLLGCTCAVKASGIGSKLFVRAYQSSMTSFFIAKSNVCDALIASHKQSVRTFGKHKHIKGIPCDHMWSNLMKVFVFVTPITKPLGGQIEDYSDIRNKKMNYSNYIKIKIDRKLEDELDKEKEDGKKDDNK